MSDVILPVLKGDVRFESLRTEMRFIIEGEDDRWQYTRKGGRWRYVNGPFVSIHGIASQIFKYRENPSEEEQWWMGDYVDGVGRMIDAVQEAIEDARIEQQRAEEERRRTMLASLPREPLPEQRTFVYLMRHTNGLTKIGRSQNPRSREKTLQAEDPRLEMIYHCEADSSVENRLHQIYDSVRIRGEWFNLMPHHVDWITAVLQSSIERRRNSDTIATD